MNQVKPRTPSTGYKSWLTLVRAKIAEILRPPFQIRKFGQRNSATLHALETLAIIITG